jgi:uncharacterized membrane protein (DUF4010 family)
MGFDVSILLLAGGEAPKAAAAAAAADPFVHLAARGGVALLLGLLIGAEREHSHTAKEHLFAGVRTFPLISLLGFTAALLSTVAGSPLVFVAVAVVFGMLVTATYVVTSLGGDKGATTEIAGLTAFFLGALCHGGSDVHVQFASAAAVVAAALLSLREAIHGFVSKFEREDIYATLKLFIVTLIVLPLLPDRTYSFHDFEPLRHLENFQILNPRSTWTYVVVLASISFAGYVAVKVVGARRGVGLTGFLGGLVSSTAVALAFSRKSREAPGQSRSLASAIVLASTVMFPRVFVVASGICPPLAGLLWKPCALLLASGLAAGFLLHRRSEENPGGADDVAFKNPFELGSAVKFGLLLAFISFASRAAYQLFKDEGYYVVSVLAGLADVDGISAQAASLGKEKVLAVGDPALVPFLSTAATAIVLAMVSNTVVKGGLTLAIGAPQLRRHTLPAFGAMAVVGVLSALFLC